MIGDAVGVFTGMNSYDAGWNGLQTLAQITPMSRIYIDFGEGSETKPVSLSFAAYITY